MSRAGSKRRRAYDRLFRFATAAAAAVALALFLGLVVVLLTRALPVLDLAFLVEPARQAGTEGGVRYQLLGTLILVATALVVQLPLATGLAVTLTVTLRRRRSARWLESLLYSANGVPSILFGIFAFLLFSQWLGWGKSWLAGGIVLGLLSVPLAALATAERLRALPDGYAESGRALGLSRAQTLVRIQLPMSRDGMISGSLLGLGRAAGETAPILFAAAVFAGATLPTGVTDNPVLALPYHVFVLAQDTFDPAARARLWGAAWVLLSVTIGCSALALPLRLRATESAGRHDA